MAASAATWSVQVCIIRISSLSPPTILPTPRHWRILLKYDSILGPLHEEVKADGDSISVGGKTHQDFRRQGSGGARLDFARRADCGGIHRQVHRQEGRGQASAGHGEEGHHLGARQGRGHHHRAGRERKRLRSGQAQRHLQRLLHHQLPGAGGEGAARERSASRKAR